MWIENGWLIASLNLHMKSRLQWVAMMKQVFFKQQIVYCANKLKSHGHFSASSGDSEGKNNVIPVWTQCRRVVELVNVVGLQAVLIPFVLQSNW
jgi:hypothetical protein